MERDTTNLYLKYVETVIVQPDILFTYANIFLC